MKRTFILALAAVMVLGLLAGAALAQGQGRGHGPPRHPLEAAPELSVITGDVEDHGDASQQYADAAAVDTVSLPEGNWQITASGAVTLDGDATALNCGLRVADDESDTGATMLAKQNSAVGGETGRVGFAVVGALEVYEGSEVDVDLVCYGGGVEAEGQPFEHNLVAVGGNKSAD